MDVSDVTLRGRPRRPRSRGESRCRCRGDPSRARGRRPLATTQVEAVEARTLLSSAVLTPAIEYARQTGDGRRRRPHDLRRADRRRHRRPQIRTAYGFAGPDVRRRHAVAADGAGQTIAIVDAYNDPNIQGRPEGVRRPVRRRRPGQLQGREPDRRQRPADHRRQLGRRDRPWTWSGPTPSPPGPTSCWSRPAATTPTTCWPAVNYARSVRRRVGRVHELGRQRVRERVRRRRVRASRRPYDATFTTPTGHQGVTFVSAAGDTGQQDGVQWPASSPNVVSVGGTAWTLNADELDRHRDRLVRHQQRVQHRRDRADLPTGDGQRPPASGAWPTWPTSGDPDYGFAVYDSLAETSDGHDLRRLAGGRRDQRRLAPVGGPDRHRRPGPHAGRHRPRSTAPPRPCPTCTTCTPRPTNATGYAAYTTTSTTSPAAEAGTVHIPRGGQGGFGGFGRPTPPPPVTTWSPAWARPRPPP